MDDKHEDRMCPYIWIQSSVYHARLLFWRFRYAPLRWSTAVRYAVPSAIENARHGYDTLHDSFGLVGVAMNYR